MEVSAPSLPILPLEIIDVIIYHCRYDKDTRRACSLVCKAWLPFSRFHLFHHRVVPIPTRRDATRLCDLLRSPHCTIVAWIHTIKLFVDPVGDHHLWIIDTLRLLVDKNVRIRKLIAMCRGLKDMQDTKYFSLLRALAGDTMTSLELYWISPIGASFLPNASAPVKGILLLSPRLKHLSLTAGIHWIGEEALQLEQLLAYLPPQVLNLSTLSITMHCMDFVLDWLSKTMAFPSLTHLYLRFKDGFDVDVLQRFLDTSVRSVKWLFIDRVLDELDPMFDNEEEFMPCLNLANLTHLQSIQLSFPDHRYFIRPIINMVRSIPPVARLTSIVLLSVYTEGQPIEQLLDLWMVLDAFLASDSHEALQQVVVRPQLGPYFGKCREKGILVDAENRYPLKKRWDVACARAYSDSY